MTWPEVTLYSIFAILIALMYMVTITTGRQDRDDDDSKGVEESE